jgi:5-methylthioribose kinase
MKNIRDFLISMGLLKVDEDVLLQEIYGGVSSTIIMIVRKREKLILKQALKWFKIEKEISVPLDRNLCEQDCIDLMNSFLAPGIVPEIRFRDRGNYLFIMTCAQDGSRQWKEILLEGKVDLTIATRIGQVLAKIHNHTAYNKEIEEKFRGNSIYILGRIDPCYREIQRLIPELRIAMQKIIDETISRQEALCTADFNPKNTLVKGKKIMLVDHEGAHYGDPSFDIGLFLAHIFLKSVHNWKLKNAYFNLARSFWNAYSSEISVWLLEDFERRVVQHIAAMMLARVIGKLPVEYLGEKDKVVVQSVSKEAILRSVSRISDLMDIICNVNQLGK